MMKKIYDAFDEIKVSEELKMKTYYKIKNSKLCSKPVKNKYRMFVYSSVAVFCLVLTIFIKGDFSAPHGNDGEVMDMFFINEAGEESLDRIVYRGGTYIFIEEVFDKNILDEKIGVMDQISGASLNSESNSAKYYGSYIYKVKNVDSLEKIAIMLEDKIFLFEKTVDYNGIR